MALVTLQGLAAADIIEIWEDIADESLAAADSWVDRLDQDWGCPRRSPRMGRARGELGRGCAAFRSGDT